MLTVLTPDGSKAIEIPFRIRNLLRRCKLLRWNPEENLLQISQDYPALVQSGFDFGRVKPAPLRASDPGRMRTPPKKGGRIDPLVKYLGTDGNGPSHAEVEGWQASGGKTKSLPERKQNDQNETQG